MAPIRKPIPRPDWHERGISRCLACGSPIVTVRGCAVCTPAQLTRARELRGEATPRLVTIRRAGVLT